MAKKSKAAADKRKKTKPATPAWKSAVDAHDFDAAASYLKNLYDEDVVLRTVQGLREATIEYQPAKDIIRSSGNQYLPADDPHVVKNLEKIKKRIPMSPVLLVVDTHRNVLVIADGYHRTCTVYNHDYDQNVPFLRVTLAPSRVVGKPRTVARTKSAGRPGTRTASKRAPSRAQATAIHV